MIGKPVTVYTCRDFTVAVLQNRKTGIACPKCGAQTLKNGKEYARRVIMQQYRCPECGYQTRGRSK